MLKEKKAPDSRPVLIPAEYIIKCIAEDRSVKYPISVAFVGDQTNASYSVRSREKLLDMLNISFIYSSSMVRISRNKGLYLDLARRGEFHVKNTLFPDLPAGARASMQQVQDLYAFALNN